MKKELPKIIIIFLITAGLVLLGLNYIFFGQAPKSKAGGETVSFNFFNVSSANQSTGDFTTTIRIKPSTDDMWVRSYHFEIAFNKSKIQFKSIDYKAGVVSSDLGDDNSKKDEINQRGKIKVMGEIQSATGKLIHGSEDTEMVTVTFTANSADSSSITTGATDARIVMIKSDHSLFGVPSAGQVSLSVNGGGGGGPTNTPVPTVTPDPVCSILTTQSNCEDQTSHPDCRWYNRCGKCARSGTPIESVCPEPTNTPAPTITQGGPTTTPTPTGTTGNVNLKLKLRFQGISDKRPTDALGKLNVRFKLYNERTEKFTDENYKTAEFTVGNLDDKGIWTGHVSFDANLNDKYVVYVKGPYQIQKKICDEEPTEAVGAGGTYRCGKGLITLKAGDNNLDFSGVIQLSGDLPDQDGTINAYDTSLIRNNLGRTDNGKCDVNRDGICDTQDYSLVISALSVKNDEL